MSEPKDTPNVDSLLFGSGMAGVLRGFGAEAGVAQGGALNQLMEKEGSLLNYGDNTNYEEKDEEAVDYEDVSEDSDFASDDEGDDADDAEAMDTTQNNVLDGPVIDLSDLLNQLKGLDPNGTLTIALRLLAGNNETLTLDQVHQVCSTQDDGDGQAILKFTELFQLQGITGEELMLQQDMKYTTYIPPSAGAQTQAEITEDDTGRYELDVGTPFLTQKQVIYVESEDEDSAAQEMEVDDVDLEQQEPTVEDSLDPQFNGVELCEWEKEIVWDNESNTNISRPQQPYLLTPPPGCEHLKVDEKPFFGRKSMELENGDWVNDICWDDDSGDENQQHTDARHRKTPAVILDLNDPQILWDDRTIWQDADEVEKEDEDDENRFREVSNDAWYRQKSKKSRSVASALDRTFVQHSLPALNLSTSKTYQDPAELCEFHRPRFFVPPGHVVEVKCPKDEGAKETDGGKVDRSKYRTGIAGSEDHQGAGVQVTSKAELSAVHGDLIQLEYLEQYPMLINNVGMGLQLNEYYRQKHDGDIPEEPKLGKSVLLHPLDESPFVADIPTGESLLSADCAMFRAAAAEHAVSETDFLLTYSLDYSHATIRPRPQTLALGQQQPLWEIPIPNTKPANSFIRARVDAFIYRWFRDPIHKGVMQIEDVRRAFPALAETNIRKRLKACGKFIRTADMGGYWVLRSDFILPSEDDICRSLPPEQVCAFESMLASQARLKRLGVRRYFNPAQIRIAFDRSSRKLKRERLKQLEKLLLVQPWWITTSFKDAIETNNPLQLRGIADPSGRGEMFDLTKVPMRASHGSAMADAMSLISSRGKRKRRLKTMFGNFELPHGSNLRRLELEEAGTVLRAFEIPEVDIPTTKWKRIAMIRDLSQAIVKGTSKCEHQELINFAKEAAAASMRLDNIKQENPVYARELREGWENQLFILRDEDPDWSSEEDSDEDDEDDAEKLDAETAQMERELQEMLEGAEEDAEADEILKGVGEIPIERGRPLPILKKVKYIRKRRERSRRRERVAPKIDKVIVEIVSDPKIVKREIERKRRVRSRAPKSLEDLEADAEKERKKRRIRENIRRLKKDLENSRNVVSALKTGNLAELEKTGLVCGACGVPGHMRTNKQCPNYKYSMVERASKSGYYAGKPDRQRGLQRATLLDEPEPEQVNNPNIRRAFDYKSSVEYSVAAAAARTGISGWNDPFNELDAIKDRPSAQSLLMNPPVPKRKRRKGEGGRRRRSKRAGRFSSSFRDHFTVDDLSEEEEEISLEEEEVEEASWHSEESEDSILRLPSDDDDEEEGSDVDSELDEHEMITKLRKRSRSRRRAEGAEGAVISMNGIFKRVLTDFMQEEMAEPFLYLVNVNKVDGYYDKIKEGVCLKDMRFRASKDGYWHSSEFWEEIDFMIQNVHIYNDDIPENQDLVELADKLKGHLQELVKAEEELCDLKLSELEVEAASEGPIEDLGFLKRAPRTAIRQLPKPRKKRAPRASSTTARKKAVSVRKRRKKDDWEEDGDFVIASSHGRPKSKKRGRPIKKKKWDSDWGDDSSEEFESSSYEGDESSGSDSAPPAAGAPVAYVDPNRPKTDVCPFCHAGEETAQPMICCDECNQWYHKHCAGIFVDPEQWYCERHPEKATPRTQLKIKLGNRAQVQATPVGSGLKIRLNPTPVQKTPLVKLKMPTSYIKQENPVTPASGHPETSAVASTTPVDRNSPTIKLPGNTTQAPASSKELKIKFPMPTADSATDTTILPDAASETAPSSLKIRFSPPAAVPQVKQEPVEIIEKESVVAVTPSQAPQPLKIRLPSKESVVQVTPSQAPQPLKIRLPQLSGNDIAVKKETLDEAKDAEEAKAKFQQKLKELNEKNNAPPQTPISNISDNDSAPKEEEKEEEEEDNSQKVAATPNLRFKINF